MNQIKKITVWAAEAKFNADKGKLEACPEKGRFVIGVFTASASLTLADYMNGKAADKAVAAFTKVFNSRAAAVVAARDFADKYLSADKVAEKVRAEIPEAEKAVDKAKAERAAAKAERAAHPEKYATAKIEAATTAAVKVALKSGDIKFKEYVMNVHGATQTELARLQAQIDAAKAPAAKVA